MVEYKNDEIRAEKERLRDDAAQYFKNLDKKKLTGMARCLEEHLFELNNFFESKIILLYVNLPTEVPTKAIINRALNSGKMVVLPTFLKNHKKIAFMRIEDRTKKIKNDSEKKISQRNTAHKMVTTKDIDIAVIPAICMDQKCIRLGSGKGIYKRIISKLSATTRKVGLVFEKQLVPIIPVKKNDGHIDIIVTEKRVIYRI